MKKLDHKSSCLNSVGSTLLKTGFRFSVILALLLAAFLLTGAVASAQTVSYSSTNRTLGSGFAGPEGVSVDSSGNVYVADYGNSAVKEILAVGGVIPGNPTIRTLGSGFSRPNGTAIDSKGDVFVADYGNNAVKEIVAVGGVIPASPTINTLGSGFNQPWAVAVDSSGNVYVGDYGNQAVKEILAVGGVIPAIPTIITLASGHQTSGVALDSSGNLYAAGWIANDVREFLAVGGVMPASPTIRTLSSSFNLPSGVAVDSSGNVYVSDVGDGKVYKMAAVGGVMPASPTVSAIASGFSDAYGVAVDGSGNIYGADTLNNAVRELAGSPNFGLVNVGSSVSLTLNFTFGTGGTINAPLVITQGMTGLDYTDAGTGTCTSNGTGHVYTNGDACTVVVTFTPKHAGSRYGAVQILSGSTILTTVFVNGTGMAPELAFSPALQSSVGSGLTGPQGVAVDGNGNVFIANTNGNTLVKVSSLGVQSTISTSPYTLSFPGGVAVDGAGNIFIADYGNSRVEEVPWNGSAYGTATLVGSGFSTPNSVAVDGNGNVYVANEGGNAVVKVPWNGTAFGTQVNLPGPTPAYSGLAPTGVAVDGNLNVYAADYHGNAAWKIGWTGSSYSTPVSVGSGLSHPFNVAVDANSNLYIADAGNNRVVVESWTGSAYGTQTVVANNTINGLSFSTGVSVDGSGNVYIADQNNNRIVKLSNSTGAKLTFPTATAIGFADSADNPQKFTILNVGNAPLTISIPGSGSNPSIANGFSYDVSSTCPDVLSSGSAGTILQGGSCTYAVDFTPTAAGTNNGSLILTDNNLYASGGSTQTVPLTGTGLPNVTQLAFTTAPATTVTAGGNAGSAITVAEENSSAGIVNTATDTITITVTGPSSYSKTYTATAVAGVATFNLSTTALTAAGTYTYTATLTGITSAVATETINAAVASTITASASYPSGGQSAAIGVGYTYPFSVTVLDQYSNPISSATVTYSVPSGSVASAVLSASTATTNSSGIASVTGTANGYAGSFSVTASVSGVATPASFAVTNNKGNSTTVLVTSSPSNGSSIAYGSAKTTLTGVTSAATSGVTTVPTGTVNFYNAGNSTSLGVSTLTSGSSSLSLYFTAGTYSSLRAIYAGDSNFLTSTSSDSQVTINQAPVTLTAATGQSVSAFSTTSTVSTTLTGAYVGTGILVPGSAGSSTVTCSFYSGSTLLASNAATVVAGSGNSTAACTVPSAVTASYGTYNVTVGFNGDSNYSASSGSTAGGSGNSLNFSFTVQKVTPIITWSPSSSLTTVTYGTSLASVLTPSASYNSTSVAGTYSYSTVIGGSTTTVTSATVLPAGSYTITTTFTPTNSAYSTATASITFTVNKATPVPALTATPNPIFVLNPVTVKATLPAVGGGVLPTGTVSFYDGSTLLNTTAATITAGVATFTFNPTVTGTHTLTAVYNGDTNYLTANSNAVSEVVADFTITVTTSPTTIQPGGIATYTVTLTPLITATFPSAITLTTSGGPSTETVTLSSTTAAAGAGITNITMTVAVPSTIVQNQKNPWQRIAPVSLALLLLPFLGKMRRKLSSAVRLVILMAVGFAAVAGLSGCGNNPSGYFGQQPKTYIITVTGTAGLLSHSTNVSLTIE